MTSTVRCVGIRAFFSVLVLGIVPVVPDAHGQGGPVTFSGTLNLSGNLYNASGVSARRPKNAARAIFRPTITIYDQIVLPFEIYWTNEERGFRQPFNQFGVSPKFFGWLTVHAGYYSTTLSELSFGNTRVLGGGIELTPGQFRFSALYGRTQKSVGRDTTRGVSGEYERRMWGGKIGFGRDDEFFVDLSVVHSEDDTSSLPNAPPEVSPYENLVGSLSFGVPMFDKTVRLTAEAAIGAFSNDTRNQEIGTFSEGIRNIFSPRSSSQVDGAASISVMVKPSSQFSLGLTGRWIGPGFVTLGYAETPNDVVEGTLNPVVRLLENTLSINASLGVRFNNLRDNRFATTKRLIGRLGSNWQITQSFGFDLQYSNYGMRSAPRNDTLRVENITQSFAVSPRYMFSGLGGMNTTMVSYSLQDFNDMSLLGSSTNDNRTRTLMAMWSIAYPSSLALTLSVVSTTAEASIVSTKVNGVTGSVGYLLFGVVTSSLTVGYNTIKSTSTDGQFLGVVGASYSLGRAGSLTLTLMTNSYDYENATAGSSFRESQGTLQYAYTF